MSERDIQKEIMLELGRFPGIRIARNDQGNGVVGKIRDLGGGNFHVHGHRLPFGLFQPGGSDLIGWQTITIPACTLGPVTIAQFLAIEVKSKTGRLRPEQENFIQVVRALGGKAIIARSVDEAVTGVLNLEI